MLKNNSNDTGRIYTDGSPILIGDIISDHSGCKGKVYKDKNWKYRVAVGLYDERDSTGISLGLFIVEGSKKVE